MRTDSTITIFNRRRNEAGKEVLQPTIIKNCTWYYAHIVSGSDMMDNADEYSVRIPLDAIFQDGRTYTPSIHFKALNDEDSAQFWTIQKNDVVVRGEMSETVENQTDITSRTDDVFIVSTFADNTIRGSKAVKHWRLGGS